MVILSERSVNRDVLQTLAAKRRELHLTVRTERVLRKPDNRHQAGALRRSRKAAIEQIGRQLRDNKRRAFRGRVAVELRLAIPDGRTRPTLPPMVKEYLDLLVELALPDDAVIDHLLVVCKRATSPSAVARLTVLPMSVFCDEYDRAFLVGSELGARATDGSDGKRLWGRASFTDVDREMLVHDEQILDLAIRLDDEEERQLDEDPDGCVDLDVPSTYAELEDAVVRSGIRREFGPSCARRRGNWFCDHGFDARDRPEGAPRWLEEVIDGDLADVVSLSDSGPGSAVLPAPPRVSTPPGGTPWKRELEREWFCSRVTRREWWGMQFGGPLALDIALSGGAGDHKDIDNVAHDVLRTFSNVFDNNNALVSGYRVYRQRLGAPQIRARVMPAVRLDVLARTMRYARVYVLRQRAERLRAASLIP